MRSPVIRVVDLAIIVLCLPVGERRNASAQPDGRVGDGSAATAADCVDAAEMLVISMHRGNWFPTRIRFVKRERSR